MQSTRLTRLLKSSVITTALFLLSGCPLLSAGYVPDGQWRGTIIDAPGTITIRVQDGFVRVIQIEGLQLESPDNPGDSTTYPIYINYGFIDGLFPGVEGLPILPTGAFVDYALTEDGSEAITGTINPDLSAGGTISIVLFAYNAADEVYDFTWTAEYVDEVEMETDLEER